MEVPIKEEWYDLELFARTLEDQDILIISTYNPIRMHKIKQEKLKGSHAFV